MRPRDPDGNFSDQIQPTPWLPRPDNIENFFETGVTTTFKMTPIMTVEEFREESGKDLENFVLMCNKICGASHYNMQMDLIVEDKASFDAWLAEQKPFEGGEEQGDTKEVAEK